MALLRGSRQKVCQLFKSHVTRQSSVSQRCFSAETAPKESDDSITVKVNPFKGHRLEPPSRDVQTNKKELLDMFEVCMGISCNSSTTYIGVLGTNGRPTEFEKENRNPMIEIYPSLKQTVGICGHL
jgi:hypothetical protein